MIPPGRFPMAPDRQVTIRKPFQMAAHETTIAQFRAFVTDTGHRTDAEKSGMGVVKHVDGQMEFGPQFTWQNENIAGENDHPVGQLSWNDADAFCRWLTRKEGRTYRLPSQAEWEWACRAGSVTAYPFDGHQESLDDYAWHAGNSGDRSHPVGQKKPNPWGLHDMLGNMAEFCFDWEAPLPAGDAIDPTGPTSGDYRVIRSLGFFDNNPTASSRGALSPGDSMNHLGFRVVCELPPINQAALPPTYKNTIGMEFVIVPKGKS